MLDDNEEYQNTLEAGQLRDEKSKHNVGKLLIDSVLRDTFSNSGIKVDFYEQYKRFERLDQFKSKFNFKE